MTMSVQARMTNSIRCDIIAVNLDKMVSERIIFKRERLLKKYEASH